jgi:hypothetical protein
MGSFGALYGLLLIAQVPPPSMGNDVARELEAARRAIVARETAELTKLAAMLARSGDQAGSEAIRAKLPEPSPADGATRFVALPEIVPKSPASARESWSAAVRARRASAAGDLYKLAQRAAKADPTCYALASACLRGVIEREPDQKEARRLLGYVPYEGGWATPYAVRKLGEGFVNHPTFGWVAADWVPHLDNGELPAPSRSPRKTQWLPVAEADVLRANWNPPWHITTEHFEIQTDVTLAEVIGFGRRLEAFYDLFASLFADVIGDRLALARRFKDPAATGEGRYTPHSIFYFKSRSEYVDHLRPKKGAEIAEGSIGFYDTPTGGSNKRSRAYFFRDPDGELPVTANLYHEVSHQLLFEMAGSNAYTKNAGNYWVFEGLGTYFETVSPQQDGSIEVGGGVGRRFEEAVRVLVGQGRIVPMAEFIDMDLNAFNRHEDIRFHYKQATALAIFLMQWHDSIYRDGFLDYVQDAFHGRIKRGSGRSLQDRVGQTYSTLDSQFLGFLKEAHARLFGASPAPSEAKRAGGRAIRTVPSSPR